MNYRLINSLFILTLFFCLSSCTRDIQYQKTENGLEYAFLEQHPEGKKGELGDYYIFDLIVTRDNDSVVSNSYESGIPAKFLRRKSLYKGDIYEALAMCSEGDSLKIRLQADSFYLSHNFTVPDYLVPGEKLTFTMKIREVLKLGQFKMKMFEQELDEIDAFVSKKRWNVKTDTLTGIKYEITKPNPAGKSIETGDQVEFTYFYYYLNEKIIAKSKEGDPWIFEVGDPNHIHGLSAALCFGREGEKLRAIIPFSEAFGEEGRAAIPPYSTIVIELDILKVNKK